jgi:hypothetical protein
LDERDFAPDFVIEKPRPAARTGAAGNERALKVSD